MFYGNKLSAFWTVFRGPAYVALIYIFMFFRQCGVGSRKKKESVLVLWLEYVDAFDLVVKAKFLMNSGSCSEPKFAHIVEKKKRVELMIPLSGSGE